MPNDEGKHGTAKDKDRVSNGMIGDDSEHEIGRHHINCKDNH